MDLCWQEQRGEARDPGEPAKAEGGRVKVLGWGWQRLLRYP